MVYAPVIVTVYDRLQHFKKCIEALKRNKLAAESELYVVSDAPGKPEHTLRIEQVRDYTRTIAGFKKVRFVFREENFGANRSFLDITRQVLDDHGRFIFLEDDVVAAPGFLDFMNGGLNFYEHEKRVFSIAAFTLPIEFPPTFKGDVFFLPSNCPWGFATWKDRWTKADLSNSDRYTLAMQDRKLRKKLISTGRYMMQVLKSDSLGWIQAPDVRVAYHQFTHDVYTVYPRETKTVNIGLDGSGLHSGTDRKKKYCVQPARSEVPVVFDAEVRLDTDIVRRIRDFQNGSLMEHVVNVLRSAKRRLIHKCRSSFTG